MSYLILVPNLNLMSSSLNKIYKIILLRIVYSSTFFVSPKFLSRSPLSLRKTCKNQIKMMFRLNLVSGLWLWTQNSHQRLTLVSESDGKILYWSVHTQYRINQLHRVGIWNLDVCLKILLIYIYISYSCITMHVSSVQI